MRLQTRLLVIGSLGALLMRGTASAAPISLRFTETQMPLGTTNSVVLLTGSEYSSFGILVDDVYRYIDNRDPFSDGAENQGASPFGFSLCDPIVHQPTCGSLAEIDFISPVSNLEIDFWMISDQTLFIDVYNSADALIASISTSLTDGSFLLGFSDISRFTWHDSGGYVQVSNIRFDSSVPEPVSLLLLGTGLVGTAIARRFRQRRS